MKKIIPFKKDIIFKTNLSEITSISLENTLKIEDKTLSGSFIISGDYKITEESKDTEKFLYDLPFNIVFDDKYDLSNSIVDINDFYYEIVNDSVLSINIEVLVDKIEEILINEEDVILETVEDKRCIEEENEVIEKKEEKRETNINLFDNISIEETYSTYKIYIVRENDTIESIMEKYNIKKDALELYNDLTELKLGDKIIIPVLYEGN
ncbi:MAG: LysM peptidoglycan-binding domain-containing protein [Bacilli bacterium]|nr:LysM peptidoglycan-binding domain-containing protein [Bacilli bacterium]